MFDFFLLIIAIISTLVLLVPFCLLTMYALIAFRQLVMGDKEKSDIKVRSARKALALVLIGMLALFLLWLYLMSLIN